MRVAMIVPGIVVKPPTLPDSDVQWSLPLPGQARWHDPFLHAAPRRGADPGRAANAAAVKPPGRRHNPLDLRAVCPKMEPSQTVFDPAPMGLLSPAPRRHSWRFRPEG